MLSSFGHVARIITILYLLFVQINTIQQYKESAVYNVPFSSRCTLVYKQLAIFRKNATESSTQLNSTVCAAGSRIGSLSSFAFPQKTTRVEICFNFCLSPSKILIKLIFLLLFCIFYLCISHGDHTFLVIRTCGSFIITFQVSSIVSVIYVERNLCCWKNT